MTARILPQNAPIGMIRRDELLHLLQAHLELRPEHWPAISALATATGLRGYFDPAQTIIIEQPKQIGR